MDAKFKKMTITPAKFDENGDIKSHEFATLTLDVSMDSVSQRNAIVELLGALDQEWVKANIEVPKQGIKVA